MKQANGIVVAVANNYATVKITDNFYQAHIRGNLKKWHNLLVGDKVLTTMINGQEVVIEKILPRKNELYRPKIVNVDQALIVNALAQPSFNTIILNKLLTLFNFYQLPTRLIFTKIDLVTQNDQVWTKIAYYQQLKYQCYFISNVAKKPQAIADLGLILQDKLSLLTGVTGVGKSSLLNTLEPSLNLVTNEISLVLNHGKHTTTTTKLYFLANGMIADSPGFLVLKLLGLTKFDIAANFPLLKDFVNQCKFRNCLHQNEPECAVIASLPGNAINQFFYQDYCKILGEFIQINS